MSRSGYSEDFDGLFNCWRGAVNSAIKGRRGQAFLREMLATFDALPEKRLIAGMLEEQGEVCALGAVGKARGIDMSKLDPEDSESIAGTFDISNALACEIVFQNDEGILFGVETPKKRFQRMRAWTVSLIREEPAP